MSEMKAKKKMVKVHNELYQDFNNLMELRSMKESPQRPESSPINERKSSTSKQQRPLAPSTSKQVEAPYSITEINGHKQIRQNSESNDNTLKSCGKFI